MLRRLSAQSVSLLLHLVVIALLVSVRTIAPASGVSMQSNHATPQGEPPQEPGRDQSLGSPPEPEISAGGGFEISKLRVGELQVDIAKIRARRTSLFPFLTLDLKFLERLPQDIQESQQRVTHPYSAAPQGTDSRDVLLMSDEALQRTVDDAWSRRERWKTFAEIARLVANHSARQGRAADLVRGYLDQNILQPYCDGTLKDPRFWAMLENAADHADFVDFVRSYAREHPSSTTTTELLFLLDELAQGSRDVVIMLIETRPELELQLTASISPEGYDLARSVKQHYASWLFEHRLDKPSVREFYDGLRLRLLSTIVATAPPDARISDARYLAGEILFNQGKLSEAQLVWRAIRPAPGDAYSRAYTEVLDAISQPIPNPREIRRILQAEYGRWRVFSIDRLRRFGHSCDTF